MTNPLNKVPRVNLPRDGGTMLDIQSLEAKWLVIFFYPKDSSSSCTAEAVGFSAIYDQFTALGAQVIGISKDSLSNHEKFIAKYDLKMPLLSDEKGTVCESFGVWKEKKMYGKTYMGIERSTFLINTNGQIIQEWRKVRVKNHPETVLQVVKNQ